jgi:hypothetical protein
LATALCWKEICCRYRISSISHITAGIIATQPY